MEYYTINNCDHIPFLFFLNKTLQMYEVQSRKYKEYI